MNQNNSPEIIKLEETENETVQNTNQNTVTETQSEQKVEKEELPKRALKFEDGTIIYDLKITYRNLFDFQRSYPGSKDLMEALVKKQTFDHETMVQLIYVGYLGTNPVKKLEYYEFIDHLAFNAKRDMFLFNDLVGLSASKKN